MFKKTSAGLAFICNGNTILITKIYTTIQINSRRKPRFFGEEDKIKMANFFKQFEKF